MNTLPEKGWVNAAGPRDQPRIAIVGDHPTEDDERIGLIFSDKSGSLLASMLARVGLRKADCYQTAVFLEKPMFNSVEHWCLTKREVEVAWAEAGNVGKYPYPHIMRSKAAKAPLYLAPERLRSIDRLKMELEMVKPNMVLALGNVACWALLGTAGITKLRGTLVKSSLVPGLKVLPTYHPSNVFQQWDLYPIVLADLDKARKSQHTAELEVPQREIWIEPTLTDLWDFYNLHMVNSRCIAVDIETQGRQITCIGFAPSKQAALVVPFWDINNKIDPNYWRTPLDEIKALRFIQAVLASKIPKVFQNGLYDMTYIWKCWGMPIAGEIHDTMILHHALQPELQKGLGFLGSIYTSEPAWKAMIKRKSDTEKRDE
jgi:uracil-DNA glycosylase